MGTRKLATSPEPEAHGRVDVTSRDVPNGVGHRQQGETESDRNAKKAQPQWVGGRIVIGENSCKHGAAAAPQYQPEGADQFGKELL